MKIRAQKILILALFAIWLFGSQSIAVYAEDKPAVGTPLFQIRQERSSNGHRQVVRFNSKTGEAWFNWTTVAPEWTKIAETGPVPPGDYEVLLLPGATSDSNWGLRYDRITGRTWNFGPNGWAEFKEPK